MKTNSIEQNYNKLKQDYEALEKEYNNLKVEITTNNKEKLFAKHISHQRSNKRLKTIMKQSDKQSKSLLKTHEDQEKILIQQSKMVSMGEMIENISHQMKQPLSLISTASSSLQLSSEMDNLDKKTLEIYTKKILEATTYLSDTIDNFKDFFREDKLKTDFSLINIIVKSKQLLEAKFKNQNIRIIHELNDIVVTGVANELIQVITNLLSNSIDAMEDKTEHKLIFITSQIKDDTIVIKVKDTGGGIDENIMKDIFKAHFTTKCEEKGTGIGLHMSKLIVNNTFKGNITVENQQFTYDDNAHSGACFIIAFSV